MEYFKCTASYSIPAIKAMFDEALERGRMPYDLRMAHIVMIPKPGTPADRCGSYNPISLINVQVKLLAKVPATRLLKEIDALIHPDQCGLCREDQPDITSAGSIMHWA